MVVREITVVKRPRNDKVEDRPISFPPLQNLHLNLMENKKKLKKNLPVVQIKKQPPKPDELNVKPYTPDMMAGKAPVSVIKRSTGASKSDASKGEKSKAGTSKGDVPKSKDRVEKGDGKSKEGKSRDNKTKGDGDPETSKEGRSKKKTKETSKDAKKGSDKKRSKKRSKEEGDIQEEEGDIQEEEEEISKEEVQEEEEEKVDAASASEEDVDEIAEDLGDNPKEEGGIQEDDPASSPPGPADADGADEEDDDPYAGLSPEERERREREEYIWRFKIMKKKYRNRNIPEFNEHDDLDMMKMTYQRSLKEISLDENVESYRMYLQFGFMGMEYVATQWLGIDLTGFTKQQRDSMHKYDSLLIELGEKSQNRWLSNLPVEIRLIGFIIIQAGIFYVGKIIAGNVGEGIADFFKAFTGQNNGASGAPGSASAADAPKKKMRGPSIKADDIKKMKEQDV